MDGAFKYKAFISYSHKDQKWASWLHRRLEQYRFPKKTISKQTAIGTVPQSLKPIFRDREELTAGANLGEVIENALSQSENLIVICSPNSVASHWVNQEILYFKRHNRGAKIFTVIVDGEPWASKLPNRQEEECLPEAIRFELGADGELSDQFAEPLAADLRVDGDGKRFGLLKLISGMVGLGLDDLVQRDLQRARRRVMGITTAAISTLLIMGTLTWLAIEARGEAEQGRADAEGLITFMLTDLRDNLEPVGRLDALDVVAERAKAYYDKYDLSKHDDDALGRRASVFHLLGDVQRKLGNSAEAEYYFENAMTATQGLLERDPDNAERVFEHAQSSYWVGLIQKQNGKFNDTESSWKQYLDLSILLNQLEPGSIRSLEELAYGHSNMGSINYTLNKLDVSKGFYDTSLGYFIELSKKDPESVRAKSKIANQYAWLATVSSEMNQPQEAYKYRGKQLEIAHSLSLENPDNYLLLENLAVARLGFANSAVNVNLFEQAGENFESALRLSEKLIARDPANTNFINHKRNTVKDYMTYSIIAGDDETFNRLDSLVEEFLDQHLNENYVDEDETFASDILMLREYYLRKIIRVVLLSDKQAIRKNFDSYEALFVKLCAQQIDSVNCLNLKTQNMFWKAAISDSKKDIRAFYEFLEREEQSLQPFLRMRKAELKLLLEEQQFMVLFPEETGQPVLKSEPSQFFLRARKAVLQKNPF